MARRIRSSKLETRTARLKLPIRKKALFVTISPGVAVGYRRCKGPGRWCVRCADGHGGSWEKSFSIGDDFEQADGEHVLTYWQACDRARALARGTDAGAGRPATLGEALDSYTDDLRARSADPGNASRARGHLTPALLAKPVSLLTARELRRWRDTLVAKGLTAATTNRTAKMVRAACNLAAKDDPRIGNRDAWRTALAALPDAHNPRDALLTDDQVRTLIAAAWALDPSVGLLVEVLAVTGARVSQVARLRIGDLQDRDARVLMPTSAKGSGRKRVQRVPLPIPASLTAKLKKAAGKRPASEALLTQGDGRPWHSDPSDHLEPFAEVAAKAGLAGVTSYHLRHSSIVRALLANLPIRTVAANHDTSVNEIERTYSKHIARFSDALTRRALLDPSSPAGNVVPLAGRVLL
jgi:integrase